MAKWERHNAPNGEHIWVGDTHIADIVTDTDNPGCDTNVTEIAKSAVLMHNNPKYQAVDELYKACILASRALSLKRHAVRKTIEEALAKADRKSEA